LAKRVTRSTLDSAISGTNLVQKPLPEALFERGAISSEERDALMTRHIAEEIFVQAFRYGESFSFQDGQVPELLLGDDPRKPPLSIQSILELTRSRIAMVEEIRSIIPSREEIFVLTEKGMAHQHAAMSDYGLSRIFDLIDGFRDLNQIIRDVVFFEFYVLRT